MYFDVLHDAPLRDACPMTRAVIFGFAKEKPRGRCGPRGYSSDDVP